MKPTLLLAPIQGITERFYRNTFQKHFDGFDYAVSPFIATSRQKNVEKKFIREFADYKDCEMQTIPQILGKDPDDFISYANTLYEMGHTTVNWNLGCPYPMVTNKGKGSGMLCYPYQVESFLEKVIPSLKGKLSIKLRLGLLYKDEILQLIPLFNRFPLTELIIHPRTGRQMYNGTVDLNAFEQCLEISSHEIAYNGDINTIVDFVSRVQRFPSIKKWMIGRGALNNPFLPMEIKNGTNYSFEEKIRIVHNFHNELFNELKNRLTSDSHIMDKMKEQWFHLSQLFPDGAKIYKRLKKKTKLNHFEEEVERAFESGTCTGGS